MQSNWPLPVRAPHAAVASLTRLLCETSTTVVRIGLPFSCAARGSTRKILASGEASAESAKRLVASRQANASSALARTCIADLDQYLSEGCITALCVSRFAARFAELLSEGAFGLAPKMLTRGAWRPAWISLQWGGSCAPD